MHKTLEGLEWKPGKVSHIGCIKGCLDYLAHDISWEWLYGGCGHAFVININPTLCPSGPTAWNYEMLFRLGKNLGYKVSSVFGCKEEPDFFNKRMQAWIHVCNSIDAGIPCYGWEMLKPEFYVITGVTDDCYVFNGPGCANGACTKPWAELGYTEIGVVEIMSIELTNCASDIDVVKDALSFAVKHSSNPGRWALSGYFTGPKAFDIWANALDQGTADGFGLAYNSAIWSECRCEAAAFLAEAKRRIGKSGQAFDEAIRCYSFVSEILTEVSNRYPIDYHFGNRSEKIKCLDSASSIRKAGFSERNGIKALARILEEL